MNESDLLTLLHLHLRRDEGLRLKPYKDSVGKITIGVGRNLEDRGISNDEADLMLSNDIRHHINDLNKALPWIKQKPVAVRLGLYNMAFNLGVPRLLGFEKMLERIDHDDYEGAAKEALDSKWAKQVGKRADRIAELFRSAV